MSNPFNSLYDGSGAYRVDVVVRGETHYASNALTFAKAEDAEAYAQHLYSRWTMMADWRIVPASTPVREEVAV